MPKDDLHFRLRIPDRLKAMVEAAAAANHRSMTAEILARLEKSFEATEGDRVSIAEVGQKLDLILAIVSGSPIRTEE